MTAGFRFIHYIDEGDVVRIVLARAPLNILGIGMLEELSAALELAAARPALKALLLAAEGKAFRAGVAVEDHLGERAQSMLEAFHRGFQKLDALEALYHAELMTTADAAEGLRAFLEKRAPVWQDR